MEMDEAYSAETVVNSYKTSWYQDSEDHTLNFTSRKTSNLIKLFSNTRGEVIGGWSKRHNMELHSLYSSLDIIKVIKSWRMRHAGIPGRKRPLESSSVDEIIILKGMVGRYDGRTDDWTYDYKWRALADAVISLSLLP